MVGCYPSQPLYLRDNGSLSHYVEQATQVEYPDVDSAPLAEVTEVRPPVTVLDPDFDSFYDLSLEECVAIALQNSKVIRGYGTPGLNGARISPGIDTLTTGSAGVGTFYNVAIRETEPGFLNAAGNIPSPSSITTNTGLDANQGVESALAEFDAQVSSNLFWARSDEPRNTVAPFDRTAFRQDQFTLQNQIGKKTAEGTQWFIRNVNVYTDNNIPLSTDPFNPGFQILPSWWRTAMELEARQPLLRGRGAFINRMPIVVSRIGADQEIANLESQLQNMVTNVEIRYWDLQAAYRNLEAAKAGRDAALTSWRIIDFRSRPPSTVDIQAYSQASEQFFFFERRVADAFNTLLAAESALRWLLGIAHSDGQIIRPIDEPTLAPIEFDFYASHDEALVLRPELRLQRWELKKRELALAYSKNGLLPEVNATMLYRFLGLGDQLISDTAPIPNFPAANSGAYNEMFEGRYQEIQMGLEYRSNVGLRRELNNVRNAQLKLAREHARLEELELDVTRELLDAFQAAAANYRTMQLAFNQWTYTTQELNYYERIVEVGTGTWDQQFDAQRRNADAEIAFYSALAEYNKTIALIHRRKGTILAYNGIDYSEGPWAGKAYQDAAEYARRRGASREVNYGWTRPEVISAGPVGSPSAPYEPTWNSEEVQLNGPEMLEEISPEMNLLPPGETPLNEPQSLPIHSSRNGGAPPLLTPTSSQQTHTTLQQSPTRTSLPGTPAAPTAGPIHPTDVPTVVTRPENSAKLDWGKFGVDDRIDVTTGVKATIKPDSDQ